MADFGGFQVKTPQEVLAEMQSQQQQIQSMRDPNARRNANIQFQMANLFGNPELKKARATEKVMKGIEETVGEGKPGDLEFERNRLSAMFTALKDVDPSAASQIASRLTELDEAQFERQRLTNIDRRAETAAENQAREANARIEKAERLNNLENVFYIETTDPETGEPTLKAYNPSDPESNLAFEKDKLRPNTKVLSRTEAVDSGMDTIDADFKLHNNSSFTTRLGTYEAQSQALSRATRIGAVLAQNPAANTSVSGLMNTLNEAATEGRAAAAKMAETMGINLDERGSMQAIDTAMQQFQWYTELDARDKGAMAGMTLNMAYVLARSLDPSGRLSDADVMFAARMIGASQGDPRVLMRVMAENVIGNANKVLAADTIDLNQLTPRERRSSIQARRLDGVMSHLSTQLEEFRPFLSHWLTDDEIEGMYNPGFIGVHEQRTRPGAARPQQTQQAEPGRSSDEDFEGLSFD